jgi:trans-aconitate methyltransferase
MQLYEELAEWWPLFSPVDHYAPEADFFRKVLEKACQPRPRTMLELGSGGGNMASHLCAHYSMTQVDLSPQMLAVSRKLNPNCEHHVGDMRTFRLGRTFDTVFVHDAICYMTTEVELRAAMVTAFEHCREGGAALFMPDYVRETFKSDTRHGGSDDGARGLRYLEWTFDPDPEDTTYVAQFAIAMREAGRDVRMITDRHVERLFAREVWLRLLRDTGFDPEKIVDLWNRDVFIARRPSR